MDGHPVRWQLPANGGPRVITYRLVTERRPFPGARNCRGLTSLDGLAARSGLPLTAIRDEIAAAFAMWEAAANVDLQGSGRRRSGRHPDRRAGRAGGLGLRRRLLRCRPRPRPSSRSRRRSSASTRRGRGRSASTATSRATTCATPWRTRSATPSGSTIRPAAIRSWATATRSASARFSRATSAAPWPLYGTPAPPTVGSPRRPAARRHGSPGLEVRSRGRRGAAAGCIPSGRRPHAAAPGCRHNATRVHHIAETGRHASRPAVAAATGESRCPCRGRVSWPLA